MRWAYEVRLSSSPSTHLPAPGHLHNQSCPNQHNSAPILQAQGHCRCPFPQQADEAADTVNLSFNVEHHTSILNTRTRVASKIAIILLQCTWTEPQVQLLPSCKETVVTSTITGQHARVICYCFGQILRARLGHEQCTYLHAQMSHLKRTWQS